jgi:hypothetical protein
MKKVILIGLLSIATVISTSCTKNNRVKNWGGTATMHLPENQKLVTVTWKESELWYLTKPMTNEDVAETYEFREESSFGLMEGKYIIKESKK